MKFTKLALNRPVSCFLIILALIVFGISSIFSFKLELQPSMELPMLVVITPYPGADPESVEELVSKEIESVGAMLSGIDTYASISQENMSMVQFLYDYDVDIDDAYSDLRVALDGVTARLPEEANEPFVMEINMDAGAIVNLSATAIGDIDLLSYVEDVVIPELETLIGVADVTVSGGKENYIKILLQEEKLKQYGVTSAQIAQSISAVDFTFPIGSITQGNQDVSVASSSSTKTVTQLNEIPIVTDKGGVITLADVAIISENQRAASSINRYQGNENIQIGIQKKQSMGTVNVADDVVKVIEKLQKENAAVDLQVTFDASETIVSSLTSVGYTLALGVFFSMVVLFLFFGDIRASLIVGSSMPISLFVALILMNAMGLSLNLVTTGALVIAIGMMVDSSIVVLESCFRQYEKERDFKSAALEGTKIILPSIVASTITTVVVYLPLSVMSGISGQMFMPLGYTIIFAMLSSLVISFTLIPLFFAKYKPREKQGMLINKLMDKISLWYEKILKRVLRHKIMSVLVSIVLLIISVVLVTSTNMELMPVVDEGIINIKATFRAGTRLDIMDEETKPLEQLVADNETVESYNISIGSGGATITAYLEEEREITTNELIEEWVVELSDTTNMDITISSGGTNMALPTGSGVPVVLEGRDMEALKVASKQVEEVMYQVPGVIKVKSDLSVASTKAEIQVDPLKAMNVGLTPIQVAMTLNQVLSGTEAMVIKNAGEEISVRIEYPEDKYNDMHALLNLEMATPYGTSVVLNEIASVVYTDTPETIVKMDGVYYVTITATTTESAKFTAQAEIIKNTNELDYEDGVYPADNVNVEMMNEEFGAIINAMLISIFLVFLVMAMQFESPKFSAMVMLSIPFSVIGSFFLLYIAGATVNMISLMGLLMLVGIVVNNGILYVDTANMLRKEMPIEEALIASGQLRMRPIFMTTLTTILSMLPLALGIGEGAILMQSMALVIIGGLIASTILILILLPSFYLLIYGKEKEKREKRKLRRKQKQRV